MQNQLIFNLYVLSYVLQVQYIYVHDTDMYLGTYYLLTHIF